MTELQKRLCEEWVIDFNAQKAGERAGIKGDNIRITAWQILQISECEAYIESLRDEQQKITGVTAAKVQAEIARLAFSDIRDYYDEHGYLKLPKDLSDNAAAALSGIEIDEIWINKEKAGETKKVKLYDKLAALDKLARRLGMFEKDNDQRKTDISILIQKEDASLGS